MKVLRSTFAGIPFNAIYIYDPYAAKRIIQTLTDAPAKVYGIDIETYKLPQFKDFVIAKKGAKEIGPKPGICPLMSGIRLVQIFDGESNAYIFDLYHIDLHDLGNLLQSKSFIAHNAIFEIKHLRNAGYPDLGISCSMIMDQLVYNAEHSPFEIEDYEDEEEDIPKGKRSYHNLAAVTQRYLGVRLSKEEQTSDWSNPELTQSQLLYAALDAVLTYRLGHILTAKLREYRMERVYSLLKRMQHVVAQMELEGFPIDWDMHTAITQKWEAHFKECEAAIEPHFRSVNVRSSKQMGVWLREYCKSKPKLLESWPETKTSLEQRELNPNIQPTYSFSRTAIYGYKDIPAIGALLEYKRYAKLLDSFGSPLCNFKHPITGHIHTSFTLGQTVTGRMSSRDPNLQQIPADKKDMRWSLRDVFRPAEGVFVVADFGQIELRVQAEFSHDPVMKRVFETGQDIYCAMATAFLGRTITPEDKEERAVGKVLMLSLGYGMQWRKLKTYAALGFDLHLSDDEAQRAVKAYYSTFKVYVSWCDRIREHAKKLGYARTHLGKIRKLNSDEVYTKAPNNYVQGTAFEILGLATLDMARQFKGTPIKLVNVVHDEVVAQCPKGMERATRAAMGEAMERAMTELFPNAPLLGLAVPHVGQSWKEAKG